DIRPRIETMPCQIEIVDQRVGQSGNTETRKNAREIAPVQNVELAEGSAAGADLLHGRLIFGAPGIGKGEPVKRKAKRLENALGFPRDAGAEIDEGTEDVEEEGLDRHGSRTNFANLSQQGGHWKSMASRFSRTGDANT